MNLLSLVNRPIDFEDGDMTNFHNCLLPWLSGFKADEATSLTQVGEVASGIAAES